MTAKSRRFAMGRKSPRQAGVSGAERDLAVAEHPGPHLDCPNVPGDRTGIGPVVSRDPTAAVIT